MYKVQLLCLSKIPKKRHGMYLCTIDDNVLLFCKQEATSSMKENKRNEIKDICIL